MGLTGLDIIVLLGVGGAAIFGWMRGFVCEVLSLVALVLVVLAVRFLHLPATAALRDFVGSTSGAAVFAFALVAGVTWVGGRMIANAIGKRTRTSVLGPVDRALGFGFGALKGLIVATLGFMLLVLVLDLWGGGPSGRPDWMRDARTYPLLNATSASVGELVDKRKRGVPLFGEDDDEAVDADRAAPKKKRDD